MFVVVVFFLGKGGMNYNDFVRLGNIVLLMIILLLILTPMMMTTKKREMGSVGRLKRKPALGVADFCLLAQLRSTQEHFREYTDTQIQKSTNTKIHKSTNRKLHKIINTQIQ